MARENGDAMKTPGFITPMPVGSEQGDAFDAPPASAPGGPVPDPLGQFPNLRHGPKELPTR